jgi:hypothetical protein
MGAWSNVTLLVSIIGSKLLYYVFGHKGRLVMLCVHVKLVTSTPAQTAEVSSTFSPFRNEVGGRGGGGGQCKAHVPYKEVHQ